MNIFLAILEDRIKQTKKEIKILLGPISFYNYCTVGSYRRYKHRIDRKKSTNELTLSTKNENIRLKLILTVRLLK